MTLLKKYATVTIYCLVLKSIVGVNKSAFDMMSDVCSYQVMIDQHGYNLYRKLFL
jgi:hypothetical protein